MCLKYAIKPLEENEYILKNFIHERNTESHNILQNWHEYKT